jgi:outer membrane protein assembly factor BamD (BamD/ComL family)
MSSSLNAASGTSASQQVNQGQWGQTNNAFQQLSQALSSGNLSSAQSAFATLQQNAPQGANAQNSQSSSTQSPFAALSSALQSGNLASAQQAFAQLQQTAGQHHHHHGSHSAAAATTTATTASAPATGSTGTALNLTV